MAPGFNWAYVCSLVLLGNIAHVLKAFQEGINKKRGKKRVYVYIDWTNVQLDQDGPELFSYLVFFFFHLHISLDDGLESHSSHQDTKSS